MVFFAAGDLVGNGFLGQGAGDEGGFAVDAGDAAAFVVDTVDGGGVHGVGQDGLRLPESGTATKLKRSGGAAKQKFFR